jgi:hypothetical protein
VLRPLFPAQRSGASACIGSARALPPRASLSAAAPQPQPDSPGGKRVPVGWDPADDDTRSPRKSGAAEAPSKMPSTHSGAVPWWLARVEAPARHDDKAAAEEGQSAAEEEQSRGAASYDAHAHARAQAHGSGEAGAVESAPAEWDTYAQARLSC